MTYKLPEPDVQVIDGEDEGCATYENCYSFKLFRESRCRFTSTGC